MADHVRDQKQGEAPTPARQEPALQPIEVVVLLRDREVDVNNGRQTEPR